MKRTIGIFATAFITTIGAVAQTAWTVDHAHSSVKFTVSHLVISEVEGNFKVFSGSLQSPKPDFTDANVEFAVDVKSVDTDNDMRDNHLKSEDFFHAEKFPHMTFKSLSWKKVGEQRYVLEGDLTIREVTRRVAFDVVYGGTIKDPWGNIKAGFRATTRINRFDYGLQFNAVTETGGAVVGREVGITLNLEFAQKEAS